MSLAQSEQVYAADMYAETLGPWKCVIEWYLTHTGTLVLPDL